MTLATEEYYDLSRGPLETNNLVDKVDEETLIGLRKKLNAFLRSQVSEGKAFSQKEKEAIHQRLRALGYIE